MFTHNKTYILFYINYFGMPVTGVGVDIVNIRRIQNAISKWGLIKFCNRFMSEREISELKIRMISHQKSIAEYVAGRFV